MLDLYEHPRPADRGDNSTAPGHAHTHAEQSAGLAFDYQRVKGASAMVN